MARESYGNKAKGTPPTKEINRWGRRLQRDWMLSDHHSTTEDEKVFNLQKIRSIAYLKEAIQWNSDDNFDRVSSMGMVMILRDCLLYTSPSPRDRQKSRMPSSA